MVGIARADVLAIPNPQDEVTGRGSVRRWHSHAERGNETEGAWGRVANGSGMIIIKRVLEKNAQADSCLFFLPEQIHNRR